jgi:hypothetical protein
VDDRGDQEPRDHEEDVHPDIAAGKVGDPGMVEHHWQHRDGAQSVDVGAVVHGFPSSSFVLKTVILRRDKALWIVLRKPITEFPHVLF